MLVSTVSIQCPCCWEIIEVLVEPGLGEQEYTEDCSVCCQPLVLSVFPADDDVDVEARPEQE